MPSNNDVRNDGRNDSPATVSGVDRRGLLTGLGATAAVIGLAGCSEAEEVIGSVGGGEVTEEFEKRTTDVDHEHLHVADLDVGVLNAGTVFLEPPVESGDIAAACTHLAENGGGEIVLPAGTWTGQFAVTEDCVTLRGRTPNGVTLRTPDGVDEPQQLLTVVGDDCTIEQLTLDGNKQGQDVAAYSSSELQHADTLGIYADRCTVRDVIAVNSMSHSIICRDYGTKGDASSGKTEAVVAAHRHGDEYEGIGNTFSNCRTEACGVASNPRASLDSRDCTRTVIENCHVVGDEHTIVGITIHGGDHVTIRDNYVENRPENLGIQIHSEATGIKAVDNHLVGGLGGIQLYNDTDDVLLRGNTVEGSDDMTSIYMIGGTATNVRLLGETIRGGEWQAVNISDQARDITISDCTFENTQTAIQVRGDTRRNLDIQGCRFRDFEYGVRFTEESSGATVQNCRFVGTDSSPRQAISLIDASDVLVSGNTFVEIATDIYRENDTDTDVGDNQFVTSAHG